MQPTAVAATATARFVAIEIALDIVSSFPRGRDEPEHPRHSDRQKRRAERPPRWPFPARQTPGDAGKSPRPAPAHGTSTGDARARPTTSPTRAGDVVPGPVGDVPNPLGDVVPDPAGDVVPDPIREVPGPTGGVPNPTDDVPKLTGDVLKVWFG
ncbi:hypothetical protein HEK616_44520 [Streptomyces nigrescens]|uniref:Uncharacterized protein n=1 Tax=Streptomyces nigrescens TaxID=1920 RepID=A0ABM7ZX91_STRNI|nr:hypothetical protein HEK616_44520 [Streptomyces nigrescens]